MTRRVPLIEVSKIHGGGRLGLTGKDFVASGVPAYGAGGRNGYVPIAEYDRPAVILSSIGARCGKCFHVQGSWTSLANTQVILPDPEVLDSRYLWYQLDDERRWPRSGTGQPFIKPSDVKSHLISVPSLAEQRRIAAILDQADALRTKRRQVLARLDALTQSIFHEACAKGPISWRRLGEVADFHGGASLPNGAPFSGQGSGSLLMKVSDMNRDGNEEWIKETALWSDQPTARSATVPAGTVVIPKRGGAIGTNKKRLTTRTTALDPNLMGVAPHRDLATSRFLHEWFKSFDLSRMTSGSTVPQLNKQDLAPLPIGLPPMHIQLDFEAQLMRLDDQRRQARDSDASMLQLLKSLQSRAFRGEL